MAKTYDKKTAAFAGYLIQNVPADLDEETMDGWMNNPAGMKKFLSGLKPPEKLKAVPAKPASLLSVVATTSLGPIAEKATSKCLLKPRYVYRAGDIDVWLPVNQPEAGPCVVTTLGFSQNWTFVKAAATILGIGAGTAPALLGKLLIERGHTMTLAQVEEMVENAECGEGASMSTDRYANFFFAETGYGKDSVSVGHVLRGSLGWFAYIHQFDHAYRWRAYSRLLVRNLDTLKLGL